MKQLQPVIWSKGTFLTPQHLQAHDRFLEDSLQFQLQALGFRTWGFCTLQFDEQALPEGRLAIVQAAGIFPDGLLFDIPESDAAPPMKSLIECFTSDQTTLDVFLAVPCHRDHGVNVASGKLGGAPRYSAELMMLRDENTAGLEKPVQVARKNLRLLIEGESREGYSVLRIARVEHTGAGIFRMNPHYVPPLLNVAASDYLSGMARALVEIIAAKASILSGSRRQKNQSLADFTVADIANFWLLYTLNSHFPLLRPYAEGCGGQPERLYSAMLSLAGALTTFSLTVQPRDLPEYDHDALGNCFTLMDERLRMLLKTIVPSNFAALPLKLVRPSIYATDIPDDKYLENTKLYLAISAENNAVEIIGRVPQLAKVCSATHIEQLIRQALPGLKLAHMPNPPSAIPVKMRYQYFSVNQEGSAWEAIRRARNFAVYLPGEFRNPQLEVLVLLPAAVPQTG